MVVVRPFPGQMEHPMAKTHRRTSYRRSKRWNPSRYQSDEQANATTRIIRRGSRNPGTFTRYLGDGSKVSVTDDGQVTVTDKGGVFSRYRIGYDRLAHFIRDLKKPARRSDKYDYQGESLKDEGSYKVSLNPGRKGRKSRSHKARGHRGTKRKSRGARVARWGRGRGRGGKGRRNPRIKRSEARAIGKVLKRHGYRCKAKPARRARRSRR